MTTNRRRETRPDDEHDGRADAPDLQHDFWGDDIGWDADAPPAAETAGDAVHRRPSPRRWADRLLSGRTEPTRSHRTISANVPLADPLVDPLAGDDDPTPVHRHDEPVADGYVSDRLTVATDRFDVGLRDADWETDRDADWDDGWDATPAPIARSGVDPLLARIGGLAVVATLLVPLAMGLRSDPAEPSSVATTVESTIAVAATLPVESRPEADSEAVTVSPAAESIAADAVGTTSDRSTSDNSTSDNTTSDNTTSDNTASAPAPAPTSVASALTGSAALGDDTPEPVAVDEPAVASEPAEAVGPRCGSDYEVVAGDFWLRLADESGVDLADLLAVNDASVDTALFPGRSICLPEGARTPAPPVTVPSTSASSDEATTTAAPSTTPPASAAPTTAAPTTTAPTPTPTTTAPAPPPAPAAPADVERIIREVWPDELEERALQIAWRESNYLPTAKNFCCYGLFQIYWDVHRGWLADLGVTSAEQLYDPATNARAAYTLYQRAGGWGPWGF